jgi:plastocyanin
MPGARLARRASTIVSPCLLLAAALALSDANAGEGRLAAPDRAPPEGVPNTLQLPSSGDPIEERAQVLVETANLLTRAGKARALGHAWLAEQIFSAAELLVGREMLASLAPLFRAQAPERVNTPVRHFGPSTSAQPRLVGRSDEDDPVAEPAPGELAGKLRFEGPQPSELVGVVTLDPVDVPVRTLRPQRRVMEQRDRRFNPHVLVVPVGSTVVFPNFDPIYHNVFSVSPAQPFDLGLYRGGDGAEVRFIKPGVIQLGCNLHLNMTGYVVVVKSPHYAVSDERGRFSFAKLQPGRYTLRAWSAVRAEVVTQRVVIKPGRNSVAVRMVGAVAPDTVVDKFGAVRSVQ